MLTTDYGQARDWLEQVVSPASAPALSETSLDTALVQSKVVDSQDRAPVDDGYVPTYNASYAAALLFDMKAAAATSAGGIVSFTSEGSTVNRKSATTADFQALAAKYRGEAFPSGGVSVIDLGSTLHTYPRSSFEGVTPDASPWRD